jgi:predicted DNA-binding transcriptional regulator AlpA
MTSSLELQRRALARALAGERAHHAGVVIAAGQSCNTVTAVATAPRRNGDRADRGDDGDDGDHGDDGDSDDRPRRLPTYIRFRDIQTAGIAASWTQLNRLIAGAAFPVGVMLSPNIRAWKLTEVERWLQTRPTERKSVPDRWARRRQAQSTEGTTT